MRQKKRVIIVGGGISGLAAAYYLRNVATITLIEKTERLGGWIRTKQIDDCLFECGPRGFRPAHKGAVTTTLAKELGLKPIEASRDATTRFILQKGKLTPVTPLFLIRSGVLGALVKDLFCRPTSHDDETIETFCHRHFGPRLTQRVIDPLTRGIFGGDYRTLSARSCFPSLWECDQRKGSILRGKKKGGKKMPSLYSFVNGMESLVSALSKTEMEIRLNTEVLGIEEGAVRLPSETLFADAIAVTTPPSTLARYFKCPDPHHYATITTVSLGWHHDVLKRRGFGFLVPSSEKEEVMGMTFDSAIFPEQQGATRLCAMIGREGDPNEMIQIAHEAAARLCGIATPPEVTSLFVAKQAITQYGVGHAGWLNQLENQLPKGVVILGSGLRGVGVNDCIFDAAQLVSGLIQSWQ